MLLLIGAILTFAVAAACSIFAQRNYETTWPADTSQVWWADPQFLAKPNPGCYVTKCAGSRYVEIKFPWQTEEKVPLPCNRGYVVLTLQGFGLTEQHALGFHSHHNQGTAEYLKYLALKVDEFVQEVYAPYIVDYRKTIKEMAALLSSKDEILLQTGWPFKAFSGLQIENREKELRVLQLINGCLVVSNNWTDGEEPWIIPIRPIWMGLASNTLLYAGIIWALLFAPGTIKRLLRRRKRQCHFCGYPIGVSEVCTECGIALDRFSIDCASTRRPGAAR